MSNSDLACIVLPPGHGKTHMHLMIPGLVEAECVVGCRSTMALNSLRRKAKASGDWLAYDTEWIRLLKESLPEGKHVVMLPTYELAVRSGWKILGGAVLCRTAWTENLMKRGGESDKHYDLWYNTACRFRKVFSTNADLDAWVMLLGLKWLEGESDGIAWIL